jgi:hypothetical protein
MSIIVRTQKILCLMGVASLILCAAAPKRDWKTGTLIDSKEIREVAGSRAMNQVTGSSSQSSQAVVYAELIGYVIKGEDMGWMLQYRERPASLFCRAKRPSVTINGPVKYCYAKGKFYLLDEDGQEFEMTVMRKEMLTPPSAPPKKEN